MARGTPKSAILMMSGSSKPAVHDLHRCVLRVDGRQQHLGVKVLIVHSHRLLGNIGGFFGTFSSLLFFLVQRGRDLSFTPPRMPVLAKVLFIVGLARHAPLALSLCRPGFDLLYAGALADPGADLLVRPQGSSKCTGFCR